MQHWKPSLFKLAFNLFGFSRPFMKNKKIFYLRCERDQAKTNWKDTDSDSDFYYYALFTKYNKINIYRIYMKYKRKRLNNT